jgi:hypothetical protein
VMECLSSCGLSSPTTSRSIASVPDGELSEIGWGWGSESSPSRLIRHTTL